MGLFQNILQNIQDRLKVSAFDYEQIASILSTALQVPISKDFITVKGRILFIQVSPLLGHEIQIKKVLLFAVLKEHSFSFLDIKTTVL